MIRTKKSSEITQITCHETPDNGISSYAVVQVLQCKKSIEEYGYTKLKTCFRVLRFLKKNIQFLV